MERMDINAQKRKRTRDEADDQKKECNKGKKQEIISFLDKDSSYIEKGYEYFCDSIGVFDFPWLKEGSVFEVDKFLEHEDQDVFAPYSYYEDNTFAANLDQSNNCVQYSLLVSPPPLDQNLHDNYKFDGEGLCSFRSSVDDLEPLDCIWSSVIDQPLDNNLLNKS